MGPPRICLSMADGQEQKTRTLDVGNVDLAPRQMVLGVLGEGKEIKVLLPLPNVSQATSAHSARAHHTTFADARGPTTTSCKVSRRKILTTSSRSTTAPVSTLDTTKGRTTRSASTIGTGRMVRPALPVRQSHRTSSSMDFSIRVLVLRSLHRQPPLRRFQPSSKKSTRTKTRTPP